MNAKIDNKTQESMHKLANAFAHERINGAIDEIEQKLKGTDGQIVFSREQIKALIGKYLAISYVKGYGDCYERKEQRSLFF